MANPTVFTWVVPTTNVDGSIITSGELTGYTIGVGAAAGVYTIMTSVADPAATSEPIAALSAVLVPGTYFAAIRAESTAGPSDFSNEVSFSIAASPPVPPSNFFVS